MSEVIQYTVGMSNGFFIRNGKTVIAVDSGGEPGKDVFLRVCAENSIIPSDISLLVVTHGHVDHFVNIGPMKEVTGAPILCHMEAARFLRGGLSPRVIGRNQAGRDIMEAQKKNGDPISVIPKINPDIVFEGDYDLKPWGIDGKIIETPGHSGCSTAIMLDSGEALVGDTIVETPGTGTIGLAFLSDTENSDDLLFESVQRILDAATTIYSGHGGPFTHDEAARALEEEKRACGSNKT